MAKLNFDKYYDRPEMWENLFQNLRDSGADNSLETSHWLTPELRTYAKTFQVSILYLNGTFLYDPQKGEDVCLKGPVLPATINFFYQKAVQAKRQLTLIHMDGQIENYYFGSQEASDIQDPNYPQTKDFQDRSGVRFALLKDDIVGVIFKAETAILETEWKNFNLLNELHLGQIRHTRYEIVATRA